MLKYIQELPVNKVLALSQLSTKLDLLLLLMKDTGINSIHMFRKSRIVYTSNGCYLYLEVFETHDWSGDKLSHVYYQKYNSDEK